MNTAFLARHQAHWDWRAAANFMCGGAGAGLLLAAVLWRPGGLAGDALLLAGMALVGAGLFFVWLEIGRPWRALNVFLHPGRSWMSREALVAVLLFLCGAGLAAGWDAFTGPTALAAAAFLYCQARILGAARAIPAWRQPLTVPLVVTTGLAEGLGLFLLAAAWQAPGLAPAAALAALLVLRALLWLAWRRALAQAGHLAALRGMARGRSLLWAGGLLPLLLVLMALTGVLAPGAQAATLAVAGVLAAAAGAFFKLDLVTRAGFHQGYALPRLPVRGVPR